MNWTCSVCTVINYNSSENCECCGTPKNSVNNNNNGGDEQAVILASIRASQTNLFGQTNEQDFINQNLQYVDFEYDPAKFEQTFEQNKKQKAKEKIVEKNKKDPANALPYEWTVSRVQKWIQSQGEIFNNTANTLANYEVDGKALLGMTTEDLQSICGKGLVTRKLGACIENLRNESNQSKEVDNKKQKSVADWSIEEIKNWVTSHGNNFSEVAANLESSGVDGKNLVAMCLEDFQSITGKGLATKRIWNEIEKLKIANWSIEEIKNWVSSYGENFAVIAANLESSGVDGKSLVAMGLEDFQSITGKGLATKRIWNEIEKFKNESNQSMETDNVKQKSFAEWSIEEIKNWVTSHGNNFSVIAANLESSGVDGKSLVAMCLDDFQSITGKGLATKRIWNEIEKLKTVTNWSIEEIKNWVSSYGENFVIIAENLESSGVDGKSLATMCLEDFQSITGKGLATKRIWNEIEKLKTQEKSKSTVHDTKMEMDEDLSDMDISQGPCDHDNWSDDELLDKPPPNKPQNSWGANTDDDGFGDDDQNNEEWTDEELDFGNEENTLDFPNAEDVDFIQDAEWQCVRCSAFNGQFTQMCLICEEVKNPNIHCDICNVDVPWMCYKPHIKSHEDQGHKSPIGIAFELVNILRTQTSGIPSCVCWDFVVAFVRKFFAMANERGIELATPEVVYHWTPEKNLNLIVDGNLKVPDGRKVLHQTDKGFYGKGVYTSPDPNYARCYGHGCQKTILCMALTGKKFKASYPKHLGAALEPGYDIHVSDDRNEMEWVFYDSAQLLPIFTLVPEDIEKVKPAIEMVKRELTTRYREVAFGSNTSMNDYMAQFGQNSAGGGNRSISNTLGNAAKSFASKLGFN